MSWYPCESEDCENEAVVEGGLCDAHQTINSLQAKLKVSGEVIGQINARCSKMEEALYDWLKRPSLSARPITKSEIKEVIGSVDGSKEA